MSQIECTVTPGEHTHTHTHTRACVFSCVCSAEGVDVQDRGRCDGVAETGLPAAADQERLPMAGVLPDMSPGTSLKTC